MADKRANIAGDIVTNFHDNLDGTWAQEVVSSSGGGGAGDASAAKQDAQTALLTTIDADTSRIPSLGQQLATASLPVVLTAAQITTLTPPAAITGFATQTTLASLDAKAPALGQALAAASVPVILPSATITTLTPPAAITGFATSAKQDTLQTSVSSLDTKAPALGQALAAGSVPIVLTASQLTILTPPAAITGFATAANQTTELASLASIDAGTPAALGQTTMSASMPVAIASNQSNLPVLPAQLDVTGSVTSATNLFSQDATGYAGVVVQVTSAGSSCTITYEASNDNTTWYGYNVGTDPTSPTSTFPFGTSTTLRMIYFPLTARYFRARVSTYGGGTVSINAHFMSVAVPGFIQQINSNTAISLGASVNHLGEVGGNTQNLVLALTVTASAYSAGNSIGGKLSFTSALRASGANITVNSLMILDRANQKPTGNLYFFNADPTAATLTDKTAFVFSTDDLKVIGCIPITTSDWVTTNTKAFFRRSGIGLPVSPTSGTTVFAAFITDSTPTFAATTDVQIVLGVLRD